MLGNALKCQIGQGKGAWRNADLEDEVHGGEQKVLGGSRQAYKV